MEQAAAPSQRSRLTQVALASAVGSCLEWYDYFVYGTAAALVFGKLFFPKADPAAGTLLARSPRSERASSSVPWEASSSGTWGTASAGARSWSRRSCSWAWARS